MDDLDYLRGRKMVLCLPGSDALRQALRERGAPCVALDVAHVGRLAARRHAFDGAVVDVAAFGGAVTPVLARLLDEALLPGARLLLRGAEGRDATRPFGGGHFQNLPWPLDGWTPQESSPMHMILGKGAASSPSPPPSPGLSVCRHADMFVGCRRVVDLGAGRGVFLDALALREIPCHGFETNADLARDAVARGRDVRCGAAPEMAEAVRDCDGVFLGHASEALGIEQMHALLLALRACLPNRARIVVRAGIVRTQALGAAVGRRQWAAVRVSRSYDMDFITVLITANGDTPTLPFPPIALTARGTAIEAPLRDAFDLERFERRVHSQGGEDGVLEALFGLYGTTNRHYVEFGCGDGVQCNTAALRRAGWQGLLMDGVSAPGAPDAVIHAAWITAENIEALFDQHGVPAEPDLMSIDLDGNDYWVWRAIRRRPRVVIAEYNANLAADRALTIPYDPQHRWDGSDFYGASLLALVQLGREKGYTLVYCTQAGVNAVFVRDDVLGLPSVDPAALWRPPNYWYRGARSVPDLSRAMLEL